MQVHDTTSKSDGALTIGVIERKLNRVCDQMELLYMKIIDLKSRLSEAEGQGKWSHWNSLSMRLSVLKGVYDMYHTYASHTSQELCRLHSLQHHEKVDQL